MVSATPSSLEGLEGHSLVITCPVAWGDMDAAQHVNNTVYFRYFESARIAYFERIAFGLDFPHSIGPILAHAQCRFRFPLTYPDTVSVGTGVTGLGEDRFVMRFTVISHRHGKVAAQGDGLIVSYDYRKQQKVPLPAEFGQLSLPWKGLTRQPLPVLPM
jgi:Predicted thioesterase